MRYAQNPFTQYYLRELAQIEDECVEFSQAHPDVASRLGMGREGSADPHVRQLIESTAFIAARLKRQIDSAPGELAYGVLQSLAPHLTQPMPSMAVVRFMPRSAHLEPVGKVLGEAVRLQATSTVGECIFTPLPAGTPLWPLTVEAVNEGGRGDGSIDVIPSPASLAPRGVFGALPAGLDRPDDIVLRIAHGSRDLAVGSPGELTFFISGALNRALAAVEALVSGLVSARIVALDGSWSRPLPSDCIEPVGFDPSERLLDRDSVLGPGALIHEFVNYPRRFCFFKVRHLQCPVPARGFHLVLGLSPLHAAAVLAVRHLILLNCVPVINLYQRSAVGLLLKEERDEYRIPRGALRHGRWDVQAVHRVRLVNKGREVEAAEYDSGIAESVAASKQVYWQGVRRERLGDSLGHASLSLRFSNLERATRDTGAFEMALLDMTCSNCDAPARLQPGQGLDVEGWDAGYAATLETLPTPYVHPLLPSDAAVIGLLSAIQSRGTDVDSLATRVRQYLGACQRTALDCACVLANSVERIEREVIAMPWRIPEGGVAMGMGCRYTVTFGDAGLGSRLLFAKVIAKFLEQAHDLSMPIEVLANGNDANMVRIA